MFAKCKNCGIIYKNNAERRYCLLCLKKIDREERILRAIEKSIEKSIGLHPQFSSFYASRYL
jgi:hypothetical protein